MKFTKGQQVECTIGINKGAPFIIEALLKDNSYSCSRADIKDGKFYRYTDATLKALN